MGVRQVSGLKQKKNIGVSLQPESKQGGAEQASAQTRDGCQGNGQEANIGDGKFKNSFI